ncbi:hypothetical protein ACJ3XI_00080 [Litorimonas sp. RW-G-Af-16]|uniref:hypothetical protein n=1 Tax=Litorimonas sp. RW-G-Af-16 TaxID=3241168 RepID=UPI00390CAC99
MAFMYDLERAARALYEGVPASSITALRRELSCSAQKIARELRCHYPHAHVQITLIGYRLRVIGDVSAAQKDSFYCQFHVSSLPPHLPKFLYTRSVFDFVGLGLAR